MKNQVRIIAGEHRSRKLLVPSVPGLRPTPGRVRETLFNWLRNDLFGACCLDLFAGSGALGFEAASRGAGTLVQVDKHPQVCASLTENIARLGLNNVNVLHTDVIHFLNGRPDQFDLVFIDPPFGKDLGTRCCLLLEANHWLQEGAKIYLETEAGWQATGLPSNWAVVHSKTAGSVAYHLYGRCASRLS